MGIKAIETRYKGYRFRSRLEARWAVFFDNLGIAWEYEREGFEFDDGTRYLPDFWLPRSELWVEVKGKLLHDDEWHKADLLLAGSGYPVLVVSKLEPLPRAFEDEPILFARDTDLVHLGQSTLLRSGDALRGHFPFLWTGVLAEHGTLDDLRAHVRTIDPKQSPDEWRDAIIVVRRYETQLYERVLVAFEAARSARFEHGESPRVRPAAQSRDDRSGRQ